jgi:hypothetical protein
MRRRPTQNAMHQKGIGSPAGCHLVVWRVQSLQSRAVHGAAKEPATRRQGKRITDGRSWHEGDVKRAVALYGWKITGD